MCYPYAYNYPQYQYTCSPAQPVATIAPQQQVVYQPYHYFCPTAVATPTPAQIPEHKESAPAHLWVGRTKAQVKEDDLRIALREGVYQPNEMKPKDAKHDQLFWCVELDGSNTLRAYKTIDEDLGAGKWNQDPRYGNLFFVREKEEQEEKKEKKKCKKG